MAKSAKILNRKANELVSVVAEQITFIRTGDLEGAKVAALALCEQIHTMSGSRETSVEFVTAMKRTNAIRVDAAKKIQKTVERLTSQGDLFDEEEDKDNTNTGEVPPNEHPSDEE